MKAMTVTQFANWLNVISSDLTEAKGGYVTEDRAINVRLYKLGMWVLGQAEKRGALNMRIADFMARCPATVRDAARALVREAQEQLKSLRTEKATKPAAPKALRKRKISAKRQAQLDAEYAARQAEAELLARLPEAEAAAYLRETM